jgi:hypothetical protein
MDHGETSVLVTSGSPGDHKSTRHHLQIVLTIPADRGTKKDFE